MPRRLTLHIGSHKTGTTSIQRFMQANRAELATRGMAYLSGRNSSVSEFVGPVETGFLPQGCRLRNAIEFYALLDAAPSDHIVASSESFSYFFHPGPIEALASGLAQRVDEVRVLVYLRRQDRHAVSHHQEGAKPHAFGAARSLWGNGLGALPAPNPRHGLYIDYDHRLGLWADVFGSAAIQARVFDRDSLYRGDVVQDALHTLGVAPEGLAPIPDQNTSLGARQAWLGHLMNGAGASASAIGKVLRAMESGPRSLPARAEAEAFYAPWREGNQRLNKRFGINALRDLFNDDFSDYPESATPVWNLAAAEAVLGELLRLGSFFATARCRAFRQMICATPRRVSAKVTLNWHSVSRKPPWHCDQAERASRLWCKALTGRPRPSSHEGRARTGRAADRPLPSSTRCG